ncbi:hypothetical protein KEM52_002610 [Ascosphaera acerosa]|nr:hypothetical protein KEM52_002610 [Ascosphaera acerosa]
MQMQTLMHWPMQRVLARCSPLRPDTAAAAAGRRAVSTGARARTHAHPSTSCGACACPRPRVRPRPRRRELHTQSTPVPSPSPSPSVPSASPIVSRHAASSTSGSSRLVKGNAVTALYSTIFAVAVLLDVQVKERQVERWKEQLEAARAEMLELQLEEARLLQNLEVRRKVRRLALPVRQRRMYSTWRELGEGSTVDGGASAVVAQASSVTPREEAAAATPSHETARAHSTTATGGPLDAILSPHITSSSEPAPILTPPAADDEDPFGEIDPSDGDPKPARDQCRGDALREEAVQRLAMRAAAIKLLLRPRIAHTYGSLSRRATEGDSTNGAADLPGKTVGELLDELARLNSRIWRLKYTKGTPYSDIVSPLTSAGKREAQRRERAQLSLHLRALFQEFTDGRMTLADLVLLVAENLLSSPVPIPSSDVELLITQFTRAHQNDIVRMLVLTLLPNGYYLTVPVIVATITFFSKTRDLYGFDGFLRFLQNLSRSPVNMPVLWRAQRVNGVEVAVPASARYPHVMNALIAAALSFDQPQRADAWLAIHRENGYDAGPEVLGAYLRYFSVQPNWAEGAPVLLRAVAYLGSSAAAAGGSVGTSPVRARSTAERLVLYMLVFCNCTGRQQLAGRIAAAAAEHGLNWRDSLNARDIRLSVQFATEQWAAAEQQWPGRSSQRGDGDHAEAEAEAEAEADRVTRSSLGRRCAAFARSIRVEIRKEMRRGHVAGDDMDDPLGAEHRRWRRGVRRRRGWLAQDDDRTAQDQSGSNDHPARSLQDWQSIADGDRSASPRTLTPSVPESGAESGAESRAESGVPSYPGTQHAASSASQSESLSESDAGLTDEQQRRQQQQTVSQTLAQTGSASDGSEHVTAASTRSSLRDDIQFITYSLKLSDMAIDDLKLEMTMETRRAELARLQDQLAKMKRSVHVR